MARTFEKMWTSLKLILILFLACEQCQGAFRLEELRESYLKALPKRQYISPNFTKRAPNANVQKIDSVWRRCQEPTQFSYEQFQRLKKYLGEGYVLNGTIENMLYQPRGKIFSGDNFDTKSEEYHIAEAGPGGCFNLKEQKPLRLVKTWGKCIRVFKYPHCFGLTLAVYPGSRIPKLILKLMQFKTIKSIGPCLSDEFLSSSLKTNGEAETVKNPQFKDHNPDLIELPQNSDENIGLRLEKLQDNKGQFTGSYKVGPKNRIQTIQVDIRNKNINANLSTKIWRSIEKFRGNETEESDVLCYIIPPKFGGPPTEKWNFFLGTQSTAELWSNVSSTFPHPSEETEKLVFFLNFIYEDDKGIRPLFFYYNAWTDRFLSYGRVLNGHHDNFRTPQINDHLQRHPQQIISPSNTAGEVERDDDIENSFFTRHDRLEKLFGGDEMSRDGNSSARNVNHKENQVWKWSDTTELYLSQFQGNYLKNDTEKMKAQAAALARMVTEPMARFYSGVNYTGDFENYIMGYPSQEGMCYGLTKLEKRLESIATFGTCIRIFSRKSCSSESLVIHPHSMKNSSLSQILRQINLSDYKSVGPCLPGEMSQSYFTPDQKFVPKITFPHFITFFNVDYNNIRFYNNFVRYTLGPQNRTVSVSAIVLPNKYLDMDNLQIGQYPVCLEAGKNICYVLPPILGGPTNQSFNIFEASQDVMEDWMTLIANFPLTTSAINIFSVNLLYDNANSTRPTWIFYYMVSPNPSYGQIYNGWRGNSSNFPRVNWGYRPENTYFRLEVFPRNGRHLGLLGFIDALIKFRLKHGWNKLVLFKDRIISIPYQYPILSENF